MFRIYRKINGHLEYLAKDKVYWARKESRAAQFNTKEEAKIAREKVAGPVPVRSYGTYPMITP